MTRVFFHIEVEDCLWDEWDHTDGPIPENIESQLEGKTIKYMSELFNSPINTDGSRNADGALICSFKTNNPDRVREVIQENLLTEGNDQIVSGAEFVIVRDFEFQD